MAEGPAEPIILGMHELPITEGILKIATDAAGGRRITSIHLVVGELSSIVDDSVQFYFDMLSKGTVAEGAALDFERRPATMVCRGLRRKLRSPGAAAILVPGLRQREVAGNRRPGVAGRIDRGKR